MFFLVHELIGNFDLEKQGRRIDLFRRARFFVRTRLQKIRTIARTIQGHFALFAAALRANAPVNSRAKAFFLADFTNGATQSWFPCKHYCIQLRDSAEEPRDFSLDNFRLQIETLPRVGLKSVTAGSSNLKFPAPGYHAGTHGKLVPASACMQSPVNMPSPAFIN